MSRHQAFRSVQGTLDEHYYHENQGESDDEDVLSEEDRILLEQGTKDVRAALGVEVSRVTTAQIQEALWHYYYDVDKSVAYLIGKFVAPRPAKATKASQISKGKDSGKLVSIEFEKKDEGLGKDLYRTSGLLEAPIFPQSSVSVHIPTAVKSSQTPISRQLLLSSTKSGGCLYQSDVRLQLSTSAWQIFQDLPWGNIPKHREALLVRIPRPRGGLLGGSGTPPKLSKLQQLAAARRKKSEDKKPEETAKTRQRLERVAVGEKTFKKENVSSTGTSGQDRKMPRSAMASMPLGYLGLDGYDLSPRTNDRISSQTEQIAGIDEQRSELSRPSVLAQTLLSSVAKTSVLSPQQQVFALPYTLRSASLDDVFSKPSPDDVVSTAQAKASKKTAPAPVRQPAAPDAITGDVKALKIDDSPLPRSKNLNVLSEFEKSHSKKTASFIVVGHVDAGKSTMMGRLLLDLKVVDERTVDKLRREAERAGKSSFALAWVLDQRTEERTRGVTIDIATNRFETERTVFTILDAPGHRDFIPNMIAGASQADFAILVIDASTGAFESGLKGQTKEHSLLIRSMGVTRVIVAVNKLDAVDWSKERFDEITNQMTGFLTSTGFLLRNISFVPCSGLNGENLVKRASNKAASWYAGPTILDELESSEPSVRALARPLRLTISEVFRTQQSAVTVSGRIDAGSLQVGDALLVQPSGEKAYAKSLRLDQEPADWAVAGQNVVIHLSHIDAIHVRVGDILCDPVAPINCLDLFTLKALAFDFLMPMHVDVHRGRLHSAGRIEEITALLDKVTGAVTKKKPKIVKPASVARIIVRLNSKVPLETGQRVVLRSGGETVAAGLLE